jgi:hypothetical protein
MNHRPVCVKCQTDFRPKNNDVVLLDVASFGDYKAWNADLWKCPKCGSEIIVGFGNSAFTEHFEPDFKEKLKTAGQSFTIYKSYENSTSYNDSNQ